MGSGTLKFRKGNTTYSLINDIYQRYLYPTFKDTVAILRIHHFISQAEGDYSNCNCYASTEQGTKVLVGSSGSGDRIYIDNSSPTVHFRKNSKTYHCAKSWWTVFKASVYYNANGGTGSMDSQSFYPDDGESITIKSNAFSKSGYSFEKWNTSPDGSGTSYNAGSTYKGNGMTLYAQWKSVFSATNWAYAYSSSNVWKTTYSGKTIYHWQEHIYTISVKVTAPSTNKYDFIIVSNSGRWNASLVSNPDISMNGSTTKTLSVQVKFRASSWDGDPMTHLVIGLRDRTNNVNTVVSKFTVSTYLSSGTTDSEE